MSNRKVIGSFMALLAISGDSAQHMLDSHRDQDNLVKKAAEKLFSGKEENIQNAPVHLFASLEKSEHDSNDMLEACQEFLDVNSGEFGESLYGTKKGKGGGTFLWSRKGKDSMEVKNSLARIAARDIENVEQTDEG